MVPMAPLRKSESRGILIQTDDLVSVQEAARILGLSRPTVYHWINRKKVLSCRLGGTLYVLRSEIERVQSISRGKDDGN